MKTSSFQISYRHCLSGVKKTNKKKFKQFCKVFKLTKKKKKKKFKTFLENIKKKNIKLNTLTLILY